MHPGTQAANVPKASSTGCLEHVVSGSTIPCYVWENPPLGCAHRLNFGNTRNGLSETVPEGGKRCLKRLGVLDSILLQQTGRTPWTRRLCQNRFHEFQEVASPAWISQVNFFSVLLGIHLSDLCIPNQCLFLKCSGKKSFLFDIQSKEAPHAGQNKNW